MLMEPEKFVGVFLEAGVDSVTVHAEALAFDYARRPKQRGYSLEMVCKPMIDMERLGAVLEPIRRAKKGAGLAINPDTMADTIFDVADKFDLILAMTVWPGFGGQKFMDSVMPKVEALRRRFPDKRIEVDGGLNSDTIGPACRAGADVIVAGTSTFRSPDPRAAVAELRERAK
jgi:ribulose-phosphate 3-epimerase